jgi:hypothetical protein
MKEIKFCVECGLPSIECRCKEPCYRCNGGGEVVACDDDICHGRGKCMHGGNSPCPECGGQGMVQPEVVDWEELPKNVKDMRTATTEESS